MNEYVLKLRAAKVIFEMQGCWLMADILNSMIIEAVTTTPKSIDIQPWWREVA